MVAIGVLQKRELLARSAGGSTTMGLLLLLLLLLLQPVAPLTLPLLQPPHS